MENTKTEKPILKNAEAIIKNSKAILDEGLSGAKATEEKERSFEEGLANNSDTEKK